MPQRLAWSLQLWQNLTILPHVNDVCMYEKTQILRFKLTEKYTVTMATAAILDFQGQILNGIFSAIFSYFFTKQVSNDKEWVYPQLQRCFFFWFPSVTMEMDPLYG